MTFDIGDIVTTISYDGAVIFKVVDVYKSSSKLEVIWRTEENHWTLLCIGEKVSVKDAALMTPSNGLLVIALGLV